MPRCTPPRVGNEGTEIGVMLLVFEVVISIAAAGLLMSVIIHVASR